MHLQSTYSMHLLLLLLLLPLLASMCCLQHDTCL